jgi:EmrB/QacA subfamily drug resistance transporter
MTTAPEFVFETGGKRPWPALWALVIGFFMILVDSTIVTVAMPTIMGGLHTDINGVVWVTSAYLLAYAVPVLITGRLGDRVGPKRIYLAGLVLFTAASAWCGVSTSIGMLVTARVFQGLGAALMTPQTMAVITRMFPPQKRGAALGLWGSVAGVATLVGPILGGVLTDTVGWEWIFFVNVPVGLVGLVLAARLVPSLETHEHSFDLLGVVLSAVGMFLLVFGLQEGETYHWGTIAGPITVWRLIAAGLVALAVFAWWQSRVRREPLLPLGLFRDRNFSLANLGISAVGFTITAMGIPLILYFQAVRGMTPTQSALMLVPMAVISAFLAPLMGRYIQTRNPRVLAVTGLFLCALALAWYTYLLHPDTPTWQLLLPAAVLGLANAGMWGPLSITATRNLPPRLAGAGAGVYNTTRQVGAVLGSAAIAVFIEARVSANLPQAAGQPRGGGPALGATLPAPLHDGFSTAMGEALLLPAAVILIAVVAALFFAPPPARAATPRSEGARAPVEA